MAKVTWVPVDKSEFLAYITEDYKGNGGITPFTSKKLGSLTTYYKKSLQAYKTENGGKVNAKYYVNSEIFNG